MSVFVNVRFLIKQLQAVIILDRDIWNSIVIVVAFDLFYDNFKAITTSMLEHEDKIIKKYNKY